MKIPIKIHSDCAKIITNWILDPKNPKKPKHLIEDRKFRLETFANKVLFSQEDFRTFFVSFLTGSSAYFANTHINHNFNPINIDVSIAYEIASELLKLKADANEIEKKVAPYKVPLCLVSKDTRPCNINENIYMYCVKDNAVLVLAMKMHGDFIPRLLDDYHLKFNFSPITFLDFELESKSIPNTIINTKELNLFNQGISLLFSIFENQAITAVEQKEWEEADQKALNSLNPEERELLGLYLPIFNRYGDLDPVIEETIDKIHDMWNSSGRAQLEWVIFSPSFCLPTWFQDFFNQLSQEDKEYLYNIDPNKMAIADNHKVLTLLKKYKGKLPN